MVPDVMRRDLTEAMKARDSARVTVLRTALAAFANAEAPVVDHGPAWQPAAHGSTEVDRLVLTAADHRRILRDLIADREDTAATYDANGRADEADNLRAEIEVLSAYL